MKRKYNNKWFYKNKHYFIYKRKKRNRRTKKPL